ncbi:3-hydroxyacyl-[acyl-carrier-protein] dehydratase FabZ [Tritonibacter multivorans]|uniref:3-hydroxyacyl-[acyl-carrier-protein] dehydratase FabZ n=1 Tax=Tritonibacter multivorans TaxID=928856 RepID=A0A0P1GJH9_9RHOB|nr:3-hydroxyacyl-ACP dehydratase FabZ [Tritonibacter multivorans]MDA7421588.1 3-hydroxyacyl-ACP dehydratase FabZ [Tritonibacter multivorans]CUH82119.1 3-hydroxyacyl-[acyl-carrier-protein] dehydratase FabZ [Tritonibacter multivorans]SFC94702.1 3-hydroxyacyl-[acyl-carrier-protein] dehydratase [Tritonibacter multivorans]
MTAEATTDLKSADIQLIQRILPHRYPFLLVDKVVDIDGYKTGRGIKNVTMNEPHFQGHFPGTPIMPGVTIVEAMAQTSGVILGVGMDMVDTDMLIYFMSIDKCKFRRKVVPGDVLEMNVEVLRGKPGGKIFKFFGRATVDGEVAAEAEFTAMVDRSGEAG